MPPAPSVPFQMTAAIQKGNQNTFGENKTPMTHATGSRTANIRQQEPRPLR